MDDHCIAFNVHGYC